MGAARQVEIEKEGPEIPEFLREEKLAGLKLPNQQTTLRLIWLADGGIPGKGVGIFEVN